MILLNNEEIKDFESVPFKERDIVYIENSPKPEINGTFQLFYGSRFGCCDLIKCALHFKLRCYHNKYLFPNRICFCASQCASNLPKNAGKSCYWQRIDLRWSQCYY